MNRKKGTQPTVTIITMTLNAERFIRQTLESVAGQDYPNLEYLIIDGGSSDRTLDIIQNYRDLNARIISEPDNGTSGALNKGFAMSSGKYVWALNADDGFAERKTVSKLVRHLEANPSCDFVFGNMIMVNEKSDRIGRRCFHDQYGFVDLLTDRRHLPFAGCLMRKSFLGRTGHGFDERLAYCNDLDFLLRLSLHGRMDYIPEDTGVFRLHGDSASGKHKKESGQESLAVCLKYLEIPETRKMLGGREKRIKALLHIHMASVCFHCGAPSEVRRHIAGAVQLDPSSFASLKTWVYFTSSLVGPRIMALIANTVRRLIQRKYWYWLC